MAPRGAALNRSARIASGVSARRGDFLRSSVFICGSSSSQLSLASPLNARASDFPPDEAVRSHSAARPSVRVQYRKFRRHARAGRGRTRSRARRPNRLRSTSRSSRSKRRRLSSTRSRRSLVTRDALVTISRSRYACASRATTVPNDRFVRTASISHRSGERLAWYISLAGIRRG